MAGAKAFVAATEAFRMIHKDPFESCEAGSTSKSALVAKLFPEAAQRE